jgi:mRNA interferase MazF
MRSGEYVPERGDLVWLNFDPQRGHEQRGKRPALVLSPRIYNEKTSLCLCLPITSKIKGYPFEVLLPEELEIKGAILSDQVKSLDFRARDARFVCKAPLEVVKRVQQNVGALTGA